MEPVSSREPDRSKPLLRWTSAAPRSAVRAAEPGRDRSASIRRGGGAGRGGRATEWAPLPPSEPCRRGHGAGRAVGGRRPAEFAPDPVPIPQPRPEAKESRGSRVFNATVVLACLFLAAVAAAVAVRALHHPTTTAVRRPRSPLRPMPPLPLRPLRLRPGSRRPPMPSTPPRPPPAWGSRRLRHSPRRRTSRR